MRYGSVCSGIEAASVAWQPLGWECAFVSEIERFPRAVLKHRLDAGGAGPALYGDFTKIGEDDESIELLVGGTPCQSFSTAGQRLGLDDPRGNLTLEFIALSRRLRARWFLLENVPGLLSADDGRDFGTVLAAAAGYATGSFFMPPDGWQSAGICEPAGADGFGLAWRVLDAQFTRVSAFPRAVPQRRRRLFIVGYRRDWRPAAAVLFDAGGVPRDIAPIRSARKDIAPAAAKSIGDNSGKRAFGVQECVARAKPRNTREDGVTEDVSYTLESYAPHSIAVIEDKSYGLEERIARAKPVNVPSTGWAEDVSPALQTCRPHSVAVVREATIYHHNKSNSVTPSSVAAAVRSAASHNYQFVAVPEENADVAPTLLERVNKGTTSTVEEGSIIVERESQSNEAVLRRLTPLECERLQGLPDNWTRIPWRGKPPEECPNGLRYRAVGNSMAVNVMRWLGERIELVDEIVRHHDALA